MPARGSAVRRLSQGALAGPAGLIGRPTVADKTSPAERLAALTL